MINAAIVALGRWGRRLVDSVQESGKSRGDRICFTHAVVRTPANAADYCARQNLILTDFDSVLRDKTVDAVVIATPHSQHADQIVACAAVGKPVFVEKPFTLHAADARRAVAAARGAGIVVALGHNRRFLPAMRALKAMIDRGELGTIVHVEGNFSGAFGFDYKPGMWRAADDEAPAGGLTAMGIHTIDSMIHLCGPIARVNARARRRVLPAVDDTADAMLDFADGATGYLVTMMATPRIWRLQVFGTKGWAHMRDHHVVDYCGADANPRTETYPIVDIERAELEAFADAIAGRAAYPLTPDEMVQGVAAMEAIVRSIAAGTPQAV